MTPAERLAQEIREIVSKISRGTANTHTTVLELQKLIEARETALRTALEFYADEGNYSAIRRRDVPEYTCQVLLDEGEKARKAIGEVRG